MITNNNPSPLLAAESITLIRQYAAAAEQTGQLHPEQLQLIYDQNWFNLFVPRLMGGLEMSLPEGVRLQECLARADGGFGWTVTLCSGANWFIGFMDKSAAAAFFSDKQVCLAGSGAATGKATLTENGYTVNGYWKYATGAPHATAFTANCVIEKDGELILQEDGSPLVKAFIFRKEEVEIHNTWNATGMRATASHSFSVKALHIPKNRCFIIEPGHACLPDLVFRFPFQLFAEVTIAANYCGIAFHFMDECKPIFEERIKRHGYAIKEACEMLEILGRTQSKLEDARQLFYRILEKTWENGSMEKRWDTLDLENLNEACRTMVKLARSSVDDLYPYCGMIATEQGSGINRVWRDFHTASLHAVFTFGCG
ncbi:acyl-CoA dehydrogenase [Agriterribacter sp.]|uniref:acyl-CoA dehydrogenase n=1 Tax=Agriterribacter sp. TaxID=2821509 RepID=UPI002C75A183|nr:acyl-CoA dehydrogenase [Agriterribacter sp.]HRO45170.1 acyl-CoA dehydrogenase [Agriterribacter sp.]